MFNEEYDIDTSDDDTSSGRGAKGSIKDRLISILYRKRYEKFCLQKGFYTKENISRKKEYIRVIKDFDIEKVDKLDDEDKKVIRSIDFIIPVIPLDTKKIDIYVPEVKEEKLFDKPVMESNKFDNEITDVSDTFKELHTLSEYIEEIEPVYEINNREIEVDPDTETFDFDKYDYFELEEIKKGMDIKNPPEEDNEIIDIEKEEELAIDEETIVEEITKFIDKSLETLDEIKKEVEVIEDEVEKPYTIEQAVELENRQNNLRNKIDKLKDQYDTVKEKYNFEDFAILDSIEIMDAVDDYLDKAKLDNIEVMVNVCKNEIEKIDGIVVEKDKSLKVSADIQDKKEEIVDRTIAFEINREKTKKQERVEDRVALELVEQRKILNDIKERVDKIEVINIPEVRITGYMRMFASILRIAAGILTTPLSNRRIFGIALGASLINRGLRGLRQGLTVEQTTETVYKYEDLEREIINCKDKLELTNVLLLDSIEQVKKLREEFKDKFSAYVYLIPEYKEAQDKLNNLQKTLEMKHIEVKAIDKDLDMQKKKNNEKIRRLNNRRK